MGDKYDSLKLKNQLCFPLYLCSKEIIRKYSPMLSKIDLTYTQYIVMMYFWENRESNVKDISKTLLIDSSTLTPILKKLESKGFITRNRSMTDERNLVVSVTDKGMKLRDDALSIPCEMSSCLKLSEEEAKSLYMLTYKILMNVEKED